MKPEIKQKMNDLNELIHHEVNKALQNVLPEGKVAHIKEIRLAISEDERSGFIETQEKIFAEGDNEKIHNAIPNDKIACTNPILLPNGQLICKH